MNVAVIAQSCKYFAAPFFAKALGAKLYSIDRTQDKFFGDIIKVNRFSRNINADYLFFIGTRSLLYCANRLDFNKYKKCAVIFSDTNCARLEKSWKAVVKKHGITTYAMPDLIRYCYKSTIPIYQTMILPDIVKQTTNNQPVVICHSPGKKAKYKGTDIIVSVVNELKKKYDIELNLLTDKPWVECLKEKARSDIMIDQIVVGNKNFDNSRFKNNKKYQGAIGKSGLEGMLLGCCTVSGCEQPVTEPHFYRPPVVYTDAKKLKDDLEYLIKNAGERKDIAESQTVWAKRHLAPDFMREYATQHITGKVIKIDNMLKTTEPPNKVYPYETV